MALDPAVKEKAEYWAENPVFDETTRTEIRDLLSAGNDEELTERFYKDLEFGTGGLRGILGAGTSRMNIYNIRKATTALARHLIDVQGGEGLQVAISHDSRRFSREFAQAAAEVLAANRIKVFITKELRPVPMLSFMTRHKECHAGICVTASHNPPDYNGFKVYWQTGGQIVPPHDAKVIEKYNELSDYADIQHVAYADALASGMIVELGEELDEAYFEQVANLSLSDRGRENFKIVYTPLHGAGLYPVTEMLKRMGFTDVIVVPEQRDPDGSFPTVKSPNPEDESAMELALKLAKKENADLVMATDPDCDRIGMYIRNGDEFFRPNGNQIGCLLNDFVLSRLKDKDRLPPAPLIVKTIVTTDMQKDLAEEYGAVCEETLTGFKWICQLIEDYETGKRSPKRTFICGGEESYGFMDGRFVRDKDGVVSCCVAAEMAAFYKSKGLKITDVLDRMFSRHGVYHETLHNLVLPGKAGAEKISKMMEKLRDDPPPVIDGIQVKKLRDFKVSKEMVAGKDGFQITGSLSLPKSNVLQFILEDGTKVSVRPSGTEPKIKFYVSVKDPRGKGASPDELQSLKAACEERAKRIEEIFVNMAQ